MMGAILAQTLRTKWRQIIYWGGGMGLLGLVNVAAIPDVDALQRYGELIEVMPSVMLEAFGGGDAAFLATPEGYLSLNFFGVLLLIFSVYAMIAGLNVTASEEDDGSLDALLSWPIERRQLIVEKLLAYVVIMMGILSLTLIGLYFGIQLTPAFSMGFFRLAENTINVLPGLLLMMVFTSWIAAVVRRKSLAMGLATTFLVLSYFVDTLGRAASSSFLNDLRSLSFFNYYDSARVLEHGLDLFEIALVLAVTTVLTIATIVAFERRDIGL